MQEYKNEIVKVTFGKKGFNEKNGKKVPWQLYNIHYKGPNEEDWRIGTFSKSTAQKAKDLAGQEAYLGITKTDGGNKLEYLRAEGEQIPHPAAKQTSSSSSGSDVNNATDSRKIALEAAVSTVQTLLKVSLIKKAEIAIAKINEFREDYNQWLLGTNTQQAKETIEEEFGPTEEVGEDEVPF